MKKSLLVFLFYSFSIFCIPTNACLNYFYGTDKDGHTHEASYIMEDFFIKTLILKNTLTTYANFTKS